MGDVNANPICSVLMPSRGRPDGLLRAITSFIESSAPGAVEFLIRLDIDDEATMKRHHEISALPGVKVFAGPREDIHELYCPLYAVALGRWLTLWNDDATICGLGWDEQLAALPMIGVLAQPEIYLLNASEYRRKGWTGFPFFPYGCWKIFGWPDCIPSPGDTMVTLAAHRHRWKVEFLKGITAFHDRRADATLPRV